MSDKPNVHIATMLKNVEPKFDKEGKLAAIALENVDGTKFGSLLESKNALALIHAAIRVCQWLPPYRPNPNDAEQEGVFQTEVDGIEFWPGRNPTEVEVRVLAGGLRMGFLVNMDLLLAHIRELLFHIEKDPRVPDRTQ